MALITKTRLAPANLNSAYIFDSYVRIYSRARGSLSCLQVARTACT